MARHHSSKRHKDHVVSKGMHRMESEAVMEREEGAMIHNDYSKLANLPTEVMMKPYPMHTAYIGMDMEDNIAGIDKQIDYDSRKLRSGLSPHKY